MKLAIYTSPVLWIGCFIFLAFWAVPAPVFSAVTMQTDDETVLSTGKGDKPTNITSDESGHSMQVTHPRHSDSSGTMDNITIIPEIYWNQGNWQGNSGSWPGNWHGNWHGHKQPSPPKPPHPPHKPGLPDSGQIHPGNAKPEHSRPGNQISGRQRPDDQRPEHQKPGHQRPERPAQSGAHTQETMRSPSSPSTPVTPPAPANPAPPLTPPVPPAPAAQPVR